ncbi:MAG: helix-turn-helix domain-containing protein [Cyanobacteriota bacterium]|nr:helix-turn-helix domain-containing protein [Cyanobacteriota bacterium]
MFVGTTEAATLLGISTQRVRVLLKQGRIQGAKKIARAWIIPLFKGTPRVARGKRGPKPNWRPRQHCADNTVHINRQSIAYNQKHQTTEKPVVSVKRGIKNLALGCEAEIHGPCRLVYRPDKPHGCGATVWIETLAEVTLYDLESVPVTVGTRWELEPE